LIDKQRDLYKQRECFDGLMRIKYNDFRNNNSHENHLSLN